MTSSPNRQDCQEWLADLSAAPEPNFDQNRNDQRSWQYSQIPDIEKDSVDGNTQRFQFNSERLEELDPVFGEAVVRSLIR